MPCIVWFRPPITSTKILIYWRIITSTIGGNLEKGNGILLGAHDVEEILNKLPPDVSVAPMRPTSFFYNLYGLYGDNKKPGVIAANYGADDVVPWVSPMDIAAAIAEEIVNPRFPAEKCAKNHVASKK